MKKRVWSLLLVLCLMVSMFPSVSIAANSAQSGDLTVNKPTIQQIQAAYQAVSPITSNRFSETPSITAPYSPGALTEEYLQNGLTFFNYVRYVAGLPSVQMTDGNNQNAQYGAVLLAANDTLTHHPVQPSDMDDSFYYIASGATSSSNLSSGYPSLQGAITGQLSDSSSPSNLATVGHRRWLLNPTLLRVGFGAAESASGRVYTDIPVFNQSGRAVNYRFISWPASGNMPNHLMSKNTPWSVTLSLTAYQIPSESDLTITLTRKADGKSWKFDSTTSTTPSAESYFCIETSGYGVRNAIIFRPPVADIDNYIGTYTVKLDGLKDLNGADASFTYDVTFFDIDTGSTVHSHSYGSPTRVWSSDYRSCNLVFTCES
ncbi:CAP domain-containing protein, partial [Butyricicoccus sp.]|uniref:CAP domain-containing protein n=1 Tax=Butyricicoccus sp. TaxID=2049021 RepID=UPI003F155917